MTLKHRPFPSRRRGTQTSAPVLTAPSAHVDLALGVATAVIGTLESAAHLSPAPLSEAAALSLKILERVQVCVNRSDSCVTTT